LLDRHFDAFRRVYDGRFAEKYGFWRPIVERSVTAFLGCGDLHEGFARVRCGDCGHEMLPLHWHPHIHALVTCGAFIASFLNCPSWTSNDWISPRSARTIRSAWTSTRSMPTSTIRPSNFHRRQAVRGGCASIE
ncbi:MAG: hypothetical protein GX594_07635, partial [Pirellulaceae bacterium]|nr:hypothetical protein [Pirellulaceae bacterium]